MIPREGEGVVFNGMWLQKLNCIAWRSGVEKREVDCGGYFLK